MIAKALFWGSLGALAWTHAGYPLTAAALARLRPRPVRKDDVTPSVTVIVPAHDEEDVIARRLENLRALDYPEFELVVASDGSRDRTGQIAASIDGVRVLDLPRGGKTRALDAAVASAASEIVAFTDANARWERDALRQLVRSFADRDVGYVCGQLRLESPSGTNREGLYWRYELLVRESESALGSVTAGNGAIYAVRRADYVEQDDPRSGHDFALPYQLAQRGRRAVYEPAAVAWEKPARDLEDEYGRKVRMFARSWQHVATGRALRGVGATFAFEIASHRVLRYSSGVLHLVLLATSVVLADKGRPYRAAVVVHAGWIALTAAGRARLPIPGAALAYYYTLVTWATVSGLARYVVAGPPAVWEKAAGTR